MDGATTANDPSVLQLATLAFQAIVGLVQILTFLLVKRVHTQTSMYPPPVRDEEEDTPPRGRRPPS